MGLNDPQWGSKNNGGPPDLEEVMRKINRKIESLFGGKFGGGAPKGGGGSTTGGMGGGGVGLIVLIVALVWIASGFYIVNEGYRGVVLRFGKQTEITQAGARWHLPYPIETVEVVNLSGVRTIEVGYRENAGNKVLKESLMLTDDENIIDIQFAVQYNLKDPAEYLFNNRMSDDKEIVRQAAETAIREVVGKNKMDFVLYEGRVQVSASATKLIQDILDRYKSGILVSQVSLKNAQPPEQVQAAFDDAVKAGQDRERQKNEGQAYANDVVPRAKGAAARLMQEADGYKQRVIANAEGDASRFKQILVEYEKAPQVTRERMYQDMKQQILASTSKVIVDQKSGGGNLLYLPLDKLIQSTNPGSEILAAKPTEQLNSAPGDATPTPSPRVRESLFGRDRESR